MTGHGEIASCAVDRAASDQAGSQQAVVAMERIAHYDACVRSTFDAGLRVG